MIAVRPMMQEDVASACRILNEIIAIGGTTAFESPFSETQFAAVYLTGDDKICCHVALDEQGEVAGFQWLGVNDELPVDCVDIATFTRREPVLKGAGRALFAETSTHAAALGFNAINATVRADNRLGLSYYDKMGFRDYSVAYGVALQDGTPVDRISKRFELTRGVAC
ncbi:GNAT family N-acetyltransferase [Ruegeria sp. Ofav3-42]|uniref:GNAT family N-acetyltransferase n=1 Tax=Ruegeria sp. Ofav3-42 TaxID=2917759 RepID=UPI001EF55295|nr:GNAT family N-acetyltransferase [Ruegeria sp. Ofav3-42]MCG7518199.1 GNAT family N-acetyltransferase [Ruegeria sp. Ofav3-42]